ncbi:protein shisa-5-like [Megalobrama amblycephala]|uniref:protein shisa-5-like n=1 Tax=Megalobrama amblycephala TaxID=75352 RepID=UPI002013D2FE|nr:protein shisa-5-like [Megalobrama amblycephala]
MASTVAVLVLLSACLFTVTVGFGDDCRSYITSSNEYKHSISCGNSIWLQHCCGTCDHRFCCSSERLKLSNHDQNMCNIKGGALALIVSVVVGTVVISTVFIICCCCPCCCIYKMCKKPTPVVGTHVTTVMNTQCIQQPVVQGAQYPAYQPVPTQPGYGGQPMQTGPYQGQPYAPGPPPPYHTVASPGYPSSQAAYAGSQAMNPMQPPAQPGTAYLPSDEFSQPAYNPAYMQPPKTGY